MSETPCDLCRSHKESIHAYCGLSRGMVAHYKLISIIMPMTKHLA